MAEKKTTSKKAAPKENVVIEENAGTPEVSSEEILAEETPEAVQEEQETVETENPEVSNDTEVVENEDKTPEEPFDEVEERPEEENQDPLKEVEDAVEKFDEVTKNLEEKVAEFEKLAPYMVESAAKETLNEIHEMEAELKKEIEAEENALTPKQKTGMRRWLGDFWNGVSSGWDN